MEIDEQWKKALRGQSAHRCSASFSKSKSRVLRSVWNVKRGKRCIPPGQKGNEKKEKRVETNSGFCSFRLDRLVANRIAPANRIRFGGLSHSAGRLRFCSPDCVQIALPLCRPLCSGIRGLLIAPQRKSDIARCQHKLWKKGKIRKDGSSDRGSAKTPHLILPRFSFDAIRLVSRCTRYRDERRHILSVSSTRQTSRLNEKFTSGQFATYSETAIRRCKRLPKIKKKWRNENGAS